MKVWDFPSTLEFYKIQNQTKNSLLNNVHFLMYHQLTMFFNLTQKIT